MTGRLQRVLAVLLAMGVLAPGEAGGGVAAPGELHELNETEAEVYRLLARHAGQLRASVLLEPRLCAIARDHCQDMVDRGYFGHTNPEGYGPNVRLYLTGYPLPNWYIPSLDANYIESLYKGWGADDSAARAVSGWVGSSAHRVHVLGEDPFYRVQVLVGVGYVQDPVSGYGNYAFVSAHEPVGEQWRSPAGFGCRLRHDGAAGVATFFGMRPQAVAQLYVSEDAGAWRLTG